MNRYLTLFLAVLCIGFASCSNKSKSSSLSYTVNGLTDITVPNYAAAPTPLIINVQYVSGPQEPITVTLTGLPANVTMSPSGTLSGTPTFSSTVNFSANGATPGTYPITVTVSSASSGSKTYNFNLKVTGSTKGGSWRIGSITYTSATVVDTTIGSQFIVTATDASGANKVDFIFPSAPTTSGTYRVTDITPNTGEVYIGVSTSSGDFYYPDTIVDISVYTVTVSISGSGYIITTPTIPMDGSSGISTFSGTITY